MEELISSDEESNKKPLNIVLLGDESSEKEKLMSKFLLLNSPQFQEKEVKNEAEILSRINHENIVKYFDSFFEGEKFYIVMEFCPDDLDKLIDRHKTENKLIDKKEV